MLRSWNNPVLLLCLLALCLTGCHSTDSTKSKRLYNLRYGQTLPEVKHAIGTEGQREFFMLRTNVLYEARSVSVDDTRKIYSLMFADGHFVSMLDQRHDRTARRE